PNLGSVIVVFDVAAALSVDSVGTVLDNDTMDTYPIERFCISSTFPTELSS
ncbi:unnamed protein product, partial [Rotaria socialis]